MPRYEYIDHEGDEHVVRAMSLDGARGTAWDREYYRTASMRLADMASSTVEQSDERGRAA